MKIQRSKGTRDLSAEEMAAFRQIERVFGDCCLKWGYKEVRTPTIEYLHLFTSAGTLTSGMLGRVYSFLDWDGWSGERVVLKPDGTIPIARLYIESMGNKGLTRLSYVTNIFIFEETGSKTRERWQCGTELIGAGSPSADAELILLSLDVLNRLGLKGIELRLSHAGLIKAILAKLGLSPEEQISMFDRILDGDAEAVDRIRAGNPEMQDIILSLLSLRGKSAGLLKNLKALSRKLPEAGAQLDDFISIADLLGALGCDYKIDIASGAGFEYYTGVIFQLFIGGEKIGGGGRYDALIPSMGGGNVPASGSALYLDRLMKLVKPEIMLRSRPQMVLVRAGAGKTGILKETFNAASRLREAGFAAELSLDESEPAGFRWILDVRRGASPLTLIDTAESGRVEADTVEEVLALLRKKGADKDSPA